MVRRFAVLFLAALCVVAVVLCAEAGERPQRAIASPFAAPFRWTVSKPLIRPVDHNGDRCYSIKDPSIVRYKDRWHLFCTIRSKKRTHQIEYLSFADWKDAGSAERHLLDLTEGYYCAPQVFFFSPQKKWYLVYQVQDPSRSPSLQPAYSTSDDVSDPKSWRKPKLLFDEHPADVRMWIDFWVICDQDKAHLFYTDHAGSMFRLETPLGQFPEGFAESREHLAVTVRGHDATGPWRLHEASHIYYVRDTGKYLALLEAVRPHPTKRNERDAELLTVLVNGLGPSTIGLLRGKYVASRKPTRDRRHTNTPSQMHHWFLFPRERSGIAASG